MSRRARLVSCAGAGVSVAALVLSSPIGVAVAASSEPAIIVNRETVQAELNPSGSLDIARLFSQLVVTGDGTYQVLDPTSGKNIRDLDGFSAPDVSNGNAKYSIDVHGRTTRRTVSDFTGTLPLTVKAEYTLDGKRRSAQDIVGKSGILDVQYTVENVSAKPTPISFTVAGKRVTKTVNVVTPYVGQLSLTLPSSFTDIDAVRADIGGDGRGGQVLNWTMVLFEPIGQVKQRFGYTARVKHAQLPEATVQAVPVSPNKKPELAYGEKGFAEGVDSAGNVAFAGATIDSNLIKLRDGAGDLLAGLTKLAAGATALKDGLAGSAAPGAHQLADGLAQAKAGSAKLAAGADQLGGGLQKVKDGSGKLAAGLGTASAGSEKLLDGSQDLATGAGLTGAGAKALSDGLLQISAGLDQLAATTGLPAVKAGLQLLRAGIDHPVGAAGPTDPGGLVQGLTAIAGGLGQVGAGLPLAKGGVDQVAAGLASAINPTNLTTGIAGLKAGVSGASALVTGAYGALCAVPATPGCSSLQSALGALGQVSGGLDHPVGALSPTDQGGLVQQSTAARDGLLLVSGGLNGAIAGVAQLQAGANAALTGVKTTLLGGVDQLITGITAAVAGVSQLAAGAKTASAGSVALADGTAKVAAGAAQLSGQGAAPLADGLAQLYAGSKALDSGLGQLASGGGQAVAGVHAIDDGLTKLSAGGTALANGLDAAADGSGQLADGLNQAKAGNVKIHDGVEALRTQAAVPLTAAGQAVATSYAERYATMQALDAKASDGALPYGAPEGASGSAAYVFTLAAATSNTRDNTTRGLAAIVLLGLASLSGFVVRRRVTS
jgi:putative membrane protein